MRHNELLPQFAAHPLRPGVAERLGKGLTLFIIGMAKKVLLGDPCPALPIRFSRRPAPQPVSARPGPARWRSRSSSSSIRFLGVLRNGNRPGADVRSRLPENFRRPYMATSLRDFWRRWHITLATLLRDYVYIPLGVTAGDRRAMRLPSW